MAVGRKGKISKGQEEADIERAREGGWMLSCIDPSSPPSVTSLTYPTSGGDDTLVLRSQATDLTLEPFIQRLRRRYLFRRAVARHPPSDTLYFPSLSPTQLTMSACLPLINICDRSVAVSADATERF